MRPYHAAIAAVVVLVAATTTIFLRRGDGDGRAQHAIELLRHPAEQRPAYDHFIDLNNPSGASLTSSDELPGVMVAFKTDIIVLDEIDYQLMRFDKDGHFMNTIINGRGSGPGEVYDVIDIAINESDSTIWVLDPNARKIHHYHIDGRFLNDITIAPAALRIARIDKDFVLLTPMSKTLFVRVDSTGSEVDTYENPLSQVAHSPLSLDGRIVATPEGGFIYVPMYAGIFFVYDSDGDIISSVRTVDDFDYATESMATTQDARVVRAPTAPASTPVVRLSDNVLFLHTRHDPASDSDYPASIHRYKWQTGEYVGSIGVPKRVSNILLHSGIAYVAIDTSLVGYPLNLVVKGNSQD